MFCRNCGKELPENSHFCPSCGAAQNNSSNGNGSSAKLKGKVFQAKVIIGSVSSFVIAIVGAIAIFFPSLFNMEVKSINEFASEVNTIDDAVKLKKFLEDNQGKTVKLNIKYSPKLLGAEVVTGETLRIMYEEGIKPGAFTCIQNENTENKLKCIGGNGVGGTKVENLFSDEDEYQMLMYTYFKNGIHEIKEGDYPDLGISIPDNMIVANSSAEVLIKFPFTAGYDADRWGEVHGATRQFFGENSNFTAFGEMSFGFDNTKDSKAFIKNGGLTFLITKDKKPLSYCISTPEYSQRKHFFVSTGKTCTVGDSVEYIDDAIKSGFSLIVKSDSQDNTLYNWSWEGYDTSEVVLSGNFFIRTKKPSDSYTVDFGFIAPEIQIASDAGYSLPSIDTYELDPIDEKTLELKSH